VPYVAGPYFVAAGWLALLILERRRPQRFELGFGVWHCLAVAIVSYQQFFGGQQVLEYHLQSSALWASTLALLGTLAARAADGQHGPKLLVFLAVLPALWAVARPIRHVPPFGVVVVAALAGACLLALIGYRPGPLPAVAAAGAVLVFLGVSAAPNSRPDLPGLATPAMVHGKYQEAFGGDGSAEVDAYQALAQFVGWIDPSRYPDGLVPGVWEYEEAERGSVDEYLNGVAWGLHVPYGVPEGDAAVQALQHLAVYDIPHLLLVGKTTDHFEQYVAMLRAHNARVTVEEKATIGGPAFHRAVWLLTLEDVPSPCPEAGQVPTCPV
jgi:hypothetical protein